MENTQFTLQQQFILAANFSSINPRKPISFTYHKTFKQLLIPKSHSTNGVVEIRDKQELLLSSDAGVYRQQLSTVLECMREELDDHRMAINENTDELTATNEFSNELARRLDKLTERVDELTLLIKGRKDEKNFSIQPLTSKEKDVFHALYVLTESQPYASYEQVARKTSLTKGIVMDHVTSMIQKGVPVLKKLDSTTVFLKLDQDFRQIQAKKNVIGLNSLLTAWG